MNDDKMLEVIAGETFQTARPEQVQLTHILYLLHAVGLGIGAFSAVTIVGAFVFCWPSIIAIIINYVKRDEVKGTFLESHYAWQSDTFWRCAIAIAVGVVLYVLVVGFLINWIIFGLTGLWAVYRIIKGWLALQAGRPIA